MELIKYSVPKEAPTWFTDYINHLGLTEGKLELTEELVTLTRGIREFEGKVILSGRARLTQQSVVGAKTSYRVSLPSWELVDNASANRQLLLRMPDNDADRPVARDYITLGVDAEVRRISTVTLTGTHIAITLIGGNPALKLGTRVYLHSEETTVTKIIRR